MLGSSCGILLSMTWQDIIFSIGQWVFIIALIPSVVSKDKPALSSSLMTGSVLAVFAFTYFTLSLWMSGASTILVAAIWFILAIQKCRADKATKNSPQ